MSPSPKPPLLRASRRGLLLGLAALSAVVAVLYGFDPNHHGFYPHCLFKAQTGWDCPGCGGLRAAHQALHGHFAAAFALNPLLFVMVPLVLALLGAEAWRARTGRELFPDRWRTRSLWVLGTMMAAFGILRNVPPSLWSMN